jgi:hypothetical protein
MTFSQLRGKYEDTEQSVSMKGKAMSSIDLPSRFAFLPSRRKPVAVIVMVGIVAFAIWTLPNWWEFWRNVGQFPSLWQIPTNRKIIIYLLIKIVSPLLIMGILGIMVWIYDLMKPSPDEEGTNIVRRKQMQHGEAAEKMGSSSTSPSMLEQKPQIHATSFSTPSLALPALVSPSYNPETPLPLLLSVQEVQRKLTGEEANSSAFLTQNGLPVLTAHQQRANNSGDSNLLIATPPQVPDRSQSVVLENVQNTVPEPLISLRLLKDISMTINVPGGRHVVVPLTLNAKRVQLLAYIAWRRGELIDRDKILEHVFGWGLSDEEATEDKLSERFESHKKLLRKKVREIVVEQINTPAGRQVIDPDLDPFSSDSGFWGLSDICRVDDIEAVETNYKVISFARKEGKLVDDIPEYVKEACDLLIAHYQGDFLSSLIKKYPSEFRSWQGRSSWVRKPYTHYRDCYLDALWYAAEYEWRLGQRYVDPENVEMQEATQRKQQEHFGRAAQKYQSYAMYACNSKFDAKVTFGAHGEFGERIGMSERALRRCVVLLGAIGKTDLVNQVWSAYHTQMKSISDQRWQPSKETQADVEAARSQTSAYRFAAQVSQISSEFSEQQRSGRQ